MADFCQQCSLELFGKDLRELAGLSTAEDTAKGLYATVLCESCGPNQVDHEGRCVSPDCVANHSKKPLPNAEKPRS